MSILSERYIIWCKSGSTRINIRSNPQDRNIRLSLHAGHWRISVTVIFPWCKVVSRDMDWYLLAKLHQSYDLQKIDSWNFWVERARDLRSLIHRDECLQSARAIQISYGYHRALENSHISAEDNCTDTLILNIRKSIPLSWFKPYYHASISTRAWRE